MRVRSLGFSTDLAVLSAGGSTIAEADNHLLVRTPSNPTYFWGNFVLVDGPDALGRGVAVFGEALPEAGHLAIGVDGTGGGVPPEAARYGLDAEVSVVLTAHAVPPALPVDADVRELSSASDWDQLVELRLEDDHPAADELYHTRRVEEARQLVEQGPALFVGAFRDGRLVSTLGIVSVGSGTARYQHVQTHSAHRRRGLAGHLLAAAASLARQRFNVERFVIVADPAGPALNLYRSLGFQDAEIQLGLVRLPGVRTSD